VLAFSMNIVSTAVPAAQIWVAKIVAYFGESGHLFRSQSGHLSERSDAGCESMVEWPF